MAQYGRPIADITVGGWSTAPLWDKVDDVTPDDATTQIQTANNPSNVTGEVRFGSVSDPNLGTGHVVRVRAYTTGSGTLAWYLYQGSMLIASCGTIPLTGSYATYSYTLTQSEADAITDYSDLRVRFTANGAGRARVTWFELEVPDAIIQKSGSAFLSGGGPLLSTIRKAALLSLLLSGAGLVAASGIETFNAKISGGWRQPATVSDDFNRPNEDPLLPPWSSARVLNSVTLAWDDDILENYGIANKQVYNRNTVAYHSQPMGADQESSIIAKENSFVGAAVRAGNEQGYVVYAEGEGYPGKERFMVWRYNPGVQGVLIADIFSDRPAWITPGHKLTLRATGTDPVVLTAYSDDVLFATIIDSSASRLTSGKIGVGSLTQYHHADSVFAAEVLIWAAGKKSFETTIAVSGGGAVAGIGKKAALLPLFISGGGNIYVSSADQYGTAAISGNGTVATMGSRGAIGSGLSIRADFTSGIDAGFSASATGGGTVTVSNGSAIVTTFVGTDEAIVRYDTALPGSKVWDVKSHFRTVSGNVTNATRALAIYQVPSLPGADVAIAAFRIEVSPQPVSGYISIRYRTPSDAQMFWDRLSSTWKSSGFSHYPSTAGNWYTARLVSDGAGWYVEIRDSAETPLMQTTAVAWANVKDDSNPFWFFVGDCAFNHYGVINYDYLDLGGSGAAVGISGGGSLTTAPEKGGKGTPVISGGGLLAGTVRKDWRGSIVLSGGGAVYASAQENAWRAVALGGGGSVVLGTVRGARSAIPIHGGGAISATGYAGTIGYATLSGGGEWIAAGNPSFVDTASVYALIHGGGTISATGTPARRGDATIFGGGFLAVVYDRNWPYLPEGTIPNADNVCHLVKMEMDYCSRTFGVAPCLATGTPCYNTWKTCRYIQAYNPITRTYRYISAEFPQALPDARPYVADVKYMPTEIKTNLTVNARVSFGMLDEPDADVDTDPYWTQRPSHSGTYWKRWLARNVNYKRRIVRIFEGVYGAAESTYIQKWVGKLENATVKGEKVTFEAVDLLKDLTKIEVPPKTNAKLALALPATTNPGQTFTITEDADKFPSFGYVRIDDEIIRYTSVNVTTKTFTIGGSSNRGVFGTVVAAHDVKAKVQITRYVSPKNPLEILLDMLLGDAGMKDSWVRDTAKTAPNAAAYTTAATYIDLNASQTNSWPGTALIEIEGAAGIEFARYISKSYIPATNVNRFVFDSYSGVVTGRALFGSTLTSATAPSQVTARLGAYEYVDTDAFYQYRDWPFRDIDFASVVSEPTKLSDLFFEIVDLIDAKAWVAENLKITIRKNTVNTPTVGYLALSDADNIVDDSGSVDLNEKSRITRMSVLWDKIVTGKTSDDLSYRRLDLAIDPDAEDNYAGPEEKVIRCRWIDPYVSLEETVQGYVKNLAVRRIQRCKHAQNLITVKVAEKDAGIPTGSYVRLSTDELLEADGNPISARMYQVVKREKGKGIATFTLLQISPRRMAVIGPAGLPAYPSATETQKGYCYIADSYGRLSDGSEGYFIW